MNINDDDIEKILYEVISDLEESSDEQDNVEEDDENSEDSDTDLYYVPQRQTDSDIEENIAANIVEEEKETVVPPKKKSRKQSPNTIIEGGVELDGLIIKPVKGVLTSKSGYSWTTAVQQPTSGKIHTRNIQQGPTSRAANTATPEECANLFITDVMLEIVLTHTNIEIERQRQTYKNPKSVTLRYICLQELKAYIGLLILSGALKNNNLSAEKVFDPKFCGNKSRNTMSLDRFRFISNCLRFDDKSTRKERVKMNKLAPIKEIWDLFLDNCKDCYQPGPYLTIGEQQVGFRGRCGFKMHFPSKPHKYGIKIIVMCDNRTKYMVNAIVYTGKGSIPPEIPAPEFFVKSLTESVQRTSRNITVDKWFTSIPLAESLFDQGLTLTGTINKNNRELPSELTDINYNNRAVNTSMFIFSEKITAVSYKPKSNKLITVISTAHSSASVNPRSKKPEIILSYNKTKGAVDIFDQMCQSTNVIRKSKRWPQTIFFNLINRACVNAYVIYLHNNSRATGRKPRIEFLLQLAEELIGPWQEERMKTNISHELRASIMEDKTVPSSSGANLEKRTYCSMCNWKKKRMTKSCCAICKKPICGEHTIKKCHMC